jgi:hypothetical protein
MWGSACEVARGSRSNVLAGSASHLSLFAFPVFTARYAEEEKGEHSRIKTRTRDLIPAFDTNNGLIIVKHYRFAPGHIPFYDCPLNTGCGYPVL